MRRKKQKQEEEIKVERRFASQEYEVEDYKLYDKLAEEQMKIRLDGHLANLKPDSFDEANGDILDNTIFAVIREAVFYLLRQRYEHAKKIREVIARREADRLEYVSMREECRQELKQLEMSYEKVCSQIQKNGEAV